MSIRRQMLRLVLGLVILPALTEAAIAQTTTAVAIPRTSEGRPDLQGVWEFRWQTSLVRPPGVTTATLDASATKALVARQAAFVASLPGNGNPPSDADFTTMLPAANGFRTSLIVDPPNGQIPWLPGKRPPPLQPDTIVNDPEDRAPAERCISGPGFPIIPVPTNSYVQIVQPPGRIMMLPEALSELRLLAPGVEALSPDVQSRWDGDTLVVDMRNFQPQYRFTAPITLVAFGPATVARETFTPVSRDEIAYRFTITDPTLYSQTWAVETTWIRSRAKLFEYACHEANYALANILQGGRRQEAKQ